MKIKSISHTRQTPVRQAVCSYFDSHKEPADYIQVMAFLESQGLIVNKTTVYRQLDFLLENGSIQEFDFGEGKKRYELTREHHHHLICTKCDKIECVEFTENLRPREAEINQDTDFQITGHMLEFFGLCKKCQTKV